MTDAEAIWSAKNDDELLGTGPAEIRVRADDATRARACGRLATATPEPAADADD